MTEKLDLVCQHASKDRGAATAGRVANQERQRIERSEVIQSGQVLASRQVGGRETDQTSQRSCQTSRDGTRGRLCRSEFDTRGLDQKQTTLEQLWSNSRMAQNSQAQPKQRLRLILRPLRRQTLYPTELRAHRRSDSKTFTIRSDTLLRGSTFRRRGRRSSRFIL